MRFNLERIIKNMKEGATLDISSNIDGTDIVAVFTKEEEGLFLQTTRDEGFMKSTTFPKVQIEEDEISDFLQLREGQAHWLFYTYIADRGTYQSLPDFEELDGVDEDDKMEFDLFVYRDPEGNHWVGGYEGLNLRPVEDVEDALCRLPIQLVITDEDILELEGQ